MNVVTTPSDHATDSPMAPPLGEQDLAAANQEPVISSPYRAWITIGSLALCTVLGFLLCLQFGAEAIPFAKSVQVLLAAWFPTHQGEGQFDAEAAILLHLRAPRLLLAFCVGSTLAIVGATLQALVRNPLADPYVLGVSSGATLGATLAMTSDWLTTALDGTGISAAALAGAVMSIIVVYRLSSSGSGLPVQTLLLAGVIVNAICSALTMFLTSLLSPDHLSRVMAWLMGSLHPAGSLQMGLTILVGLFGTVVLTLHAEPLNCLLLGEETAQSLGLDIERTKRRLFVLTAVVTGIVVAVSGMIGFVGMMIPHALRFIIGPDHRRLLPATALAGGLFLMIADTIARTVIAPSELPVGVVTALIGGPIFVWLLLSAHHEHFFGR